MKKHEKKQYRRLKFIQLIHSIFKNYFCWTDCVSWAFNPKIKGWNIFKIDKGEDCRSYSETSETKTCYCGQFYSGIPVSMMNESQLEKARNGTLTESEIKSIKKWL